TNLQQLKSNIDSLELELSEELLLKIQEIGTLYSNPCP
ncbi:MAG: aldo/keto reductase, partial [Vibrionaceae bacterium]